LIRAKVGVMMKYFSVVIVVERRHEPRGLGEDETIINGDDEIVVAWSYSHFGWFDFETKAEKIAEWNGRRKYA
jgi:hypothetical protein